MQGYLISEKPNTAFRQVKINDITLKEEPRGKQLPRKKKKIKHM